jgi:tight adherence protein B
MANFIIVLAVAWLLFLAVWYGISRAMTRQDVDRIKNRLSGGGVKAKKEPKQAAKAQTLMPVEDRVTGRVVMQLLHKYQLRDKLQDLIDQAGVRWNPARVVHSCLGMFLLAYVVIWRVAPDSLRTAALIPAAIAGCLPILYLIKLRGSRLKKFEEMFPESLEFVARSMRAGHAFSVSLEMIHREFQEPLAGEYRRAFEEHNLGLPLDAALQKMAKRIPLLDVHFFVSAVLLQKRTGGNLAEILDKLAYVIRERFKLRGRIRAVSAHGRMTAMALSCIPIGVAVIMFYVNPDYASFFVVDEIGNIMAGAAVGLQIIGYLVMKKIVSIEV